MLTRSAFNRHFTEALEFTRPCTQEQLDFCERTDRTNYACAYFSRSRYKRTRASVLDLTPNILHLISDKCYRSVMNHFLVEKYSKRFIRKYTVIRENYNFIRHILIGHLIYSSHISQNFCTHVRINFYIPYISIRVYFHIYLERNIKSLV